MTNMDINFISLVKKGANKQKIQIYKSDDYEEPETNSVDEEVKGFFDVMKSFFTGKQTIAKADTPKKAKSFTDKMAVYDVMDGMWRVTDTLTSTLRDILNDENVTDKQTDMNTAIDEFAAYMKERIKNVGKKVTKSDTDFFMAEPIEKAGKKISTARLENIKSAIVALQSIVDDVSTDTEGGDGEVKKEEITEIIKSALGESLKPITERLDKIEKEDGVEDPKKEVNKEDIAEIVKSAISDSLQPINERLATVEKARGISKQTDDEPKETVKKSDNIFAGLDI